MKYDKIRGKSVAECMMKLRSAYGPSAIILGTREVKEGGLFGSGLLASKLYEVDFMLQESAASPGRTALAGRLAEKSSLLGSDRDVRRRAVVEKALQGLRDASTREEPAVPSAAATPLPARFPRLSSDASASVAARSSSEREPQFPETRDVTDALKLAAFQPGEEDRAAIDLLLQADGPEAPGRPAPRPERAAQILRGLEEPGAQGARRKSARAAEDRPLFSAEAEGDERFQIYFEKMQGELSRAGFSEDFIRRLLRKVDHSLSPADKGEWRAVEERTREKLAEQIRIAPDLAPARGECRAVFFLGPPGSGKTTSLAKLAAKYHIIEGREVSIYSLDHYRLAATEQLKTYASVMDTPFFAPFTPREFAECLRRDGAELMLIDASGIGHKDVNRMVQLKEYLEACEVRLEKHLVLPATAAPALAEKIVLAYDRIGFDKILLTRLDESDFLGAFVELADKYNKPFSCFANGQDVPGDLLELAPADLARLAIQSEVAGKERAQIT
jgi:flagellar biosynthesis protein FlhF